MFQEFINQLKRKLTGKPTTLSSKYLPRSTSSLPHQRTNLDSSWIEDISSELPKFTETPNLIDSVKYLNDEIFDSDKLFKSPIASHRKKRILLLDDDDSSKGKLDNMLLHEEYEVIYEPSLSYTHASKVTEYLCNSHQNVDLILIDSNFSNGRELIKHLRQRFSKVLLPILILSKAPFDDQLLGYMDCGANDFMYKPLKYNELMFRMNNLLEIVCYVRKGTILNDILPHDIIQNLEHGISFMTKHHPQVTILFSDIVSYTTLSNTVATKKVIHLLNTMFCGFDDICIENCVYKVETIGDAYMIACGHDDRKDHVDRMIRTGLRMLRFVESHSILKPLQIRIGIHTGTAHSGVIGKIRPRYCFFGDTVNTASRMESHGVPGAIQISRSVLEKIRNRKAYYIENRGLIDIKGKGMMNTYIIRSGNDRISMECTRSSIDYSYLKC